MDYCKRLPLTGGAVLAVAASCRLEGEAAQGGGTMLPLEALDQPRSLCVQRAWLCLKGHVPPRSP